MRFSAAVTSVVLALAIIIGPPIGLVLLAVQTFAFAFGAVLGLQFQPYAMLYGRFLARRRGPAPELESEHPPRFAQAVGMIFCTSALLAGIVGAEVLFYLFAGAALAAAFLNAAFNYCVGCDVYLRLAHLGHHADLTEKRTDRDVPVGR